MGNSPLSPFDITLNFFNILAPCTYLPNITPSQNTSTSFKKTQKHGDQTVYI